MSRPDAANLRVPAGPQLADAATERAMRDVRQSVAGVLDLPAASMRFVRGVRLADGIATPVPHGLGRIPQFVSASCARAVDTATTLTGGAVNEVVSDTANDRTRAVVLMATGYGAAIDVDLAVA